MAILLPGGVTKRSIDTLISRRIQPFRVSATVEIAGLHGRTKRAIRQVEINPRDEKPHLCPCCENLYPRRDDTPGLPCPTCTPKGTP